MTSRRSGTYLDRIVTAHRAEAADDARPFGEVLASAQQVDEVARGFARALIATNRLAVIAEVKRRSPSKGALREDLDPRSLASVYESGGAACLSVLTDAAYFGGSTEDLQAARAGCTVPVLRKDFTVSPADVCDARLMGADAVLLIAAALDDVELADLHVLAVELGLDALVEVHDETELDRAVSIGASLVGVNQRDLVTFEVDTDRAVRVGRLMPDDVVRVAESGVRNAADARRLAHAGYHAVLVGESLVTSADPAAALGALRVDRRPMSAGPASPSP